MILHWSHHPAPAHPHNQHWAVLVNQSKLQSGRVMLIDRLVGSWLCTSVLLMFFWLFLSWMSVTGTQWWPRNNHRVVERSGDWVLLSVMQQWLSVVTVLSWALTLWHKIYLHKQCSFCIFTIYLSNLIIFNQKNILTCRKIITMIIVYNKNSL